MEDLDIQRRTAPDDLGSTPLPSPTPTMHAGASTVPAILTQPPTPSRDVQTPIRAPMHNLPADGRETVGIAGAGLQTGQAVYREGEPITVTFSGGSGSKGDWMTIVPVGFPDNNWREWVYLDGAIDGTRQFKQRLAPGAYEVRLYHDWPHGRFHVVARTTLEVR